MWSMPACFDGDEPARDGWTGGEKVQAGAHAGDNAVSNDPSEGVPQRYTSRRPEV